MKSAYKYKSARRNAQLVHLGMQIVYIAIETYTQRFCNQAFFIVIFSVLIQALNQGGAMAAVAPPCSKKYTLFKSELTLNIDDLLINILFISLFNIRQ